MTLLKRSYAAWLPSIALEESSHGPGASCTNKRESSAEHRTWKGCMAGLHPSCALAVVHRQLL